jgi:hypothetical protein
MKPIALVVLLAAPAAAAVRLVPATASVTSTTTFGPGPAAAPPGPAANVGQPYWFKTYSTAPYREIWTGELAMKNFARDLPDVVAAIEGGGGVLTEPLGTFVSSRKDQSQQIVFTVPQQKAKSLVQALRGFGDMPSPAVRAMGAPIPLDEIRAKIAVMMKEKTERGAELAKVPAAAAAEEEILEHLLMAEEVGARAVVEARFNLTVRQK